MIEYVTVVVKFCEVAKMGYKSDVDYKLNSLNLYKPGAGSKMALDNIKK